MTREEKTKEIIKRLSKLYPKPKSALVNKNPLQLLIATMMAAQTTDKLVNTLTPALFEKYPTAKDFADANVDDIAEMIQKVNFHSNKAKNIKAACKIIVEEHGGKVPATMEGLDALPGVARKTANVVLNDAFQKPAGIVVDTHVIRLANKLGLTDPVKIEKDLMEIVPKDQWQYFGHYLTYYGREYCTARKHAYEKCPLKDLYVEKEQ